jgi:putative hydroxymethylpyrimidine transport system permease protein
MFSALFVLMVMALALYLLVDRALVRLMPWAPQTLSRTED